MAILYSQSDHRIDQGASYRILIIHGRWRQGLKLGEFNLAHDRQKRVANFPEKPEIVATLAFEKHIRSERAFPQWNAGTWELGEETTSKFRALPLGKEALDMSKIEKFLCGVIRKFCRQ